MVMSNDTAAQPDQSKTQFSLAFLLLLIASASVSMLPIAWWGVSGVPVSFWVFVLGLAVILKRLGAALATAVFALPLLLFTPIFHAQRQPYPRGMCMNQVRQIALAILNYESEHGHFPPPYSTDENGRPLHSWRVLILPYLEEIALYKTIDLSKPWNHPDNLKLASRMPDVFKCPSDKSRFSDQTTTFVAVVGKNTAWPLGTPVKVSDISDGMANTLLVVESTSSRVHWMAPFDPTIESIVPVAKNGATLLLGSEHAGDISNCVFCDGHVKGLRNDLSAAKLRALVTINGQD